MDLKKRKVLAKVWNKKEKKMEPVYGSFHCWGQSYEEFEAGPGNRTMAIIELENGSIVTADPEDVIFYRKGGVKLDLREEAHKQLVDWYEEKVLKPFIAECKKHNLTDEETAETFEIAANNIIERNWKSDKRRSMWT